MDSGDHGLGLRVRAAGPSSQPVQQECVERAQDAVRGQAEVPALEQVEVYVQGREERVGESLHVGGGISPRSTARARTAATASRSQR